MPQNCHVRDCREPVVAQGLCNTHLKRVYRHGDVNAGRPKDWGQRSKHAAYAAWKNLYRHHYLDIPEEWRNDFWRFVADVPEKPDGGSMFRPDKSKPWSKDNFYWKESRVTSEDKKEYMRKWHKQAREANPRYYMDKDLRKNYGVSIEWYEEKLKEQNGTCSICKKPESVQIKGKLLKLSVDHCHAKGHARGLLCTACNRGLGLFKDDVSVLKSAIEYLSL